MSARPGWYEFKCRESANAREIAFVLGYQHASRFAARQRQQHIVPERLRDTGRFQPFGSRQLRQQIARLMPGVCRRGDRAICPLEYVDEVLLEQPAILGSSSSGSQFLRDDDTEVLERSKGAMEILERLIPAAIAKGLDKNLRVEDVLARQGRYRSASGDVISTPNRARVPSISSR
jgi:hypothetical protein